MNAAAENDGPLDGPCDERRWFFEEISSLRQQRADLMRQLAECQRENRELRARLGDDQ